MVAEMRRHGGGGGGGIMMGRAYGGWFDVLGRMCGWRGRGHDGRGERGREKEGALRMVMPILHGRTDDGWIETKVRVEHRLQYQQQ